MRTQTVIESINVKIDDTNDYSYYLQELEMSSLEELTATPQNIQENSTAEPEINSQLELSTTRFVEYELNTTMANSQEEKDSEQQK